MSAEHRLENIRLTSGEIAQLWTTFMSDSASKCVLSYFLNKVEDEEIREIVEIALSLSEKHISSIENIFNAVNNPIPYGFSDRDVNLNAKRLFSDTFMLQYIKYMSRDGLINYADAFSVCAREDVRNFFSNCIEGGVELANRSIELLLQKGLYIRPPYLDTPEEVEFIKKQGYLHGLIGHKRPLNVMEISQLFINIQTNVLGKAFVMALSQTASSERVRKYLLRGKEIAGKHITVLSDLLKEADLPAPMTFDAEVTASTEPPFSDKLIMFHVAALNNFSIALYGNSLSKVMRNDLGLTFARLAAEIGEYARDGADIMIDNEWLEKIPETVDRKELALH